MVGRLHNEIENLGEELRHPAHRKCPLTRLTAGSHSDTIYADTRGSLQFTRTLGGAYAITPVCARRVDRRSLDRGSVLSCTRCLRRAVHRDRRFRARMAGGAVRLCPCDPSRTLGIDALAVPMTETMKRTLPAGQRVEFQYLRHHFQSTRWSAWRSAKTGPPYTAWRPTTCSKRHSRDRPGSSR